MESTEQLISRFAVKGKVTSYTAFGEGHINTTYKVISEDDGVKHTYILQKINTSLFPEPDKLMSNITLVSEYIRDIVKKNGGDPDSECLTVIKTKDGFTYYTSPDGSSYRMYIFLKGITYQTAETKEIFYESAVAFGGFANLLASFDAKKLYDVLPKFHDTRRRLNDFNNSLKLDKFNRAKDVEDEIKFVLDRSGYAGKIVSLIESGEMPLKVTHNDTKLNNVLFRENGKYLAVVDFDTIMPGSICYDFGDSIRFGCNPAAEDEPDLSKVNFSIDLFETYTKGYLSSLAGSITETEKKNLVWGAILMTYECGMRFLADYLDGDIYFNTNRDKQNLDRARTQFKLVADMEKYHDALEKIVEKY